MTRLVGDFVERWQGGRNVRGRWGSLGYGANRKLHLFDPRSRFSYPKNSSHRKGQSSTCDENGRRSRTPGVYRRKGYYARSRRNDHQHTGSCKLQTHWYYWGKSKMQLTVNIPRRDTFSLSVALKNGGTTVVSFLKKSRKKKILKVRPPMNLKEKRENFFFLPGGA